MGVRRWIYNRCLYEIKTNKVKPHVNILRKLVINNVNFGTENTWMLNYDYDLRDEALRDLLHNYKTNFAKSKKSKKAFDIQFMKKKQGRESISVLSKKWNKSRNFYSSIFRPDRMKSSEHLPLKLKHTSRLVKTELGKYFLHLQNDIETFDENQVKGIISIDPGQKTFCSGYDPSGKFIEFGKQDIGRIARLLHYRNKLVSKSDKATKNVKRRKLKIAGLRIYKDAWNLVEELHKKLAKWLCENYKIILLPKLNFHYCKKLNKKSTAKLSVLRHCGFFDRLSSKAREYPGCKVIQVNESYTSITCSNCGNLHKSLRNKDIYNCSNCNLSIGRDANASKNIFMRYFIKELRF
jgi:IS605 OrfB family transposase